MDTTASHPFPGDFEDFRRARARFFHMLAADAHLRRIEREAADDMRQRQEASPVDTIVVEGELTVLTHERRLVMGFYSADQRDLADLVREALDAPEAFGIVSAGPVRIYIEPLQR